MRVPCVWLLYKQSAPAVKKYSSSRSQVNSLPIICHHLSNVISGWLSYSFTSWLLPKSLHVSSIRAISKTWYATISRECWKESSIIFVSKELRRLLITTVGTSFETDQLGQTAVIPATVLYRSFLLWRDSFELIWPLPGLTNDPFSNVTEPAMK